MRLARSKDSGPVGRRGGEHDAVIVVDPHRRCSPAWKAFGILRPFRAKPAYSQDSESLGSTVIVARDNETVFVRAVGNRCAVAFIANERVVRPKHIALA